MVDKKVNCFNLIRLMAATQVFLGHVSVHLKVPLAHIFTVVLKCFQGVPIFFIISGFLIWCSLEKTTDFKRYAKRRIFRLYPELWGGVLCSTVSILIFCRDNISWKPFGVWTFTQSTVFQFWTPNCVREFGCGTPNGSLWTIGVMFQSYIVIWFLHKLLHEKAIKYWGMFLFVGLGINVITPTIKNVLPIMIYKLYTQTFLPYIWIFILGAFICEYFEDMIILLKKNWYIFFITSAIISIIGFDRGSYGTLSTIFMAPALIGFAYRFDGIHIKYDLSYGFYIYHMVVINIMIELKYTGRLYYILVAGIMSVIMAAISYFTIGSFSRKMRKIKY